MRLRIAAPIAVLALVLAGCGGGKPVAKTHPSASPSARSKVVSSAVLLASSAKTQAARSARVAMTIDIFEDPNTPSGTMSGNGAFSFVQKAGAFVFDVDLGTQTPFQGRIEERILGDVLYMKIPALGGAKPWLKMDFKELAKKTGFDLSSLEQFRSQDPTAGLAYLQAAADSVTEVGSETIRGVETTHYAAEIDLAKAVAKAPPQFRSMISKLTTTLGVTKMPSEVWLDAQGRVRKMSYTVDLSKAKTVAPGGTGSITTTIEIYDYGVTVNVVPPPAGQVTDFATLGAH